MSFALAAVAGMDVGVESAPVAFVSAAQPEVHAVAPTASSPAPDVIAPPPAADGFSTAGGKTAAAQECRSLSPWMSRFAWIMPLAATGVAAMTFSSRGECPRMAMVVDAVSGGLLFIGVLCAMFALSAARRYGLKGVLLPASTGLFFSGGFVGLVAGWMTLTPAPVAIATPAAMDTPAASVVVAPPRLPALSGSDAKPAHVKTVAKLDVSDPARTGREAMSKHAGWYGAATAKGATISIGEFAAAAPVVAELRSLFAAHPNVLLIGIDNSRGHAALSIDPSSLRAESPDGRRILALPVQAVLETAESNRDRFLSLFNHLLEANPGQSAVYGFAFLPAETDLRAIDRVSVILNGNRVVLPGQFLSALQKADVARRLEAQASR